MATNWANLLRMFKDLPEYEALIKGRLFVDVVNEARCVFVNVVNGVTCVWHAGPRSDHRPCSV